MTNFYEKQLEELRKNNDDKEKSLIAYYTADIDSLKAIIAAKQEEIARLLDLNKNLKINEEHRLKDIRANNSELKAKIE